MDKQIKSQRKILLFTSAGDNTQFYKYWCFY